MCTLTEVFVPQYSTAVFEHLASLNPAISGIELGRCLCCRAREASLVADVGEILYVFAFSVFLNVYFPRTTPRAEKESANDAPYSREGWRKMTKTHQWLGSEPLCCGAREVNSDWDD